MKLKFKTKSFLFVLLGTIVVFSAILLNYATVPVGKTYFAIVDKKVPIYSVKTNKNVVAISFDAAWGADKTTAIMDICDEFGVKATFFLVGFWVEKYPEKVLEIYNRGFEIGLHSNTHPDMTRLSKEEIKSELQTNINSIKEITNVAPQLFRPPYGYYNNRLIEVCEELGLTCIEWSVDSLDWKGLSASELSGRVCEKSKNGSIILCHNNSDNILPGLKMILGYFNNKKTSVVPIGELIYKQNYTINTQGEQIIL